MCTTKTLVPGTLVFLAGLYYISLAISQERGLHPENTQEALSSLVLVYNFLPRCSWGNVGRAGSPPTSPTHGGKLDVLGNQPAGLPPSRSVANAHKAHFSGRWSENLSPYKISTVTNVSALTWKLKITHYTQVAINLGPTLWLTSGKHITLELLRGKSCYF